MVNDDTAAGKRPPLRLFREGTGDGEGVNGGEPLEALWEAAVGNEVSAPQIHGR